MTDQVAFIKRESCELCECKNVDVLYSRDFADSPIREFVDDYFGNRVPMDVIGGNNYELAKCKQCGFIWQAYILNDVGMDLFYDTWILGELSLQKKEQADISLKSGYARQVEVITRMIKKKPYEIDVLDFGMGWGFWCLMAKAYGFRVAGAELSEARVKYARDNGIEVLERLTADGPRKFDFINSEQVFEHIQDPLGVLKMLVSNLKPGGILRLSVPDGRGIEQKLKSPNWKPAHDAIEPLEHINCFTNKTLIKMAELAGLSLTTQPHMFGQGLLGKSYKRNVSSYLKSFAGKYYRQYLGTTLFFKK